MSQTKFCQGYKLAFFYRLKKNHVIVSNCGMCDNVSIKFHIQSGPPVKEKLIYIQM